MKTILKEEIYKKLKENLISLEKSIKQDELELKEMRSSGQVSEVEEQAQNLDMESNFLTLLNKKYSRIRNINSALVKISTGDDYGKCSACDENITTKRLLANPSVILCIECQEEREK